VVLNKELKMDTKLEAPVNKLVSIINSTVDQLILGVGEKVVISQLTAISPWLGLPVISTIFSIFVSTLAKALDNGLKINIDILVIRFQNDARKKDYENTIEQLKVTTATSTSKEEHEKALKAAREAMDKLINRNK
jgi:hypothetical protein